MKSDSSGRHWIATGAILGFLAVIAGAFAAHGLGDSSYLADKYAGQTKTVAGLEMPTSFRRLRDFNTAARYQMFHAVALILLGLFASRFTSPRLIRASGWSFTIGTILFSGSLYLLVLTTKTWLGAVTPIGGTLQLVGWIAFAVAAMNAAEKTPTA